MFRTVPVLSFAILLIAATARTNGADAPAVEEIRLAAHPAAPPVPAMQYHFMPDVIDQVPGNAALLYLTAAKQLASARADAALHPDAVAANGGSDDERMDAWLAMPITDLPRKEVAALLARYAGALNQFRLATLRDRCDFDPPFRTEGFRTLLPFLNDARALARLAALDARYRLTSGDFEGGVADLSLPLVQAHHLNDKAFLVQLLVATALDQLALRQVQEFIEQPNSPNLYWALGDLPAPLLDFRAAMKMEAASAFFSIPQLKEARAGRLTPAQWRDAVRAMGDLRTNLHAYGYPSAGEQLMSALIAVREYPLARKYLADERHFQPSQIDAMQASQVLGLYHVGMFDRRTQEVDRCLTLAFPQGIVALSRVEEAARRAAAEGSSWSLLDVFTPNVKQQYVSLAGADRRVAILRTVEAVRAYAADHDGRPPASLDDLTETPAPPDPMTAKPFDYRVQGDQVTIEGRAIEQAAPFPTAVRIVLTLTR